MGLWIDQGQEALTMYPAPVSIVSLPHLRRDVPEEVKSSLTPIGRAA